MRNLQQPGVEVRDSALANVYRAARGSVYGVGWVTARDSVRNRVWDNVWVNVWDNVRGTVKNLVADTIDDTLQE